MESALLKITVETLVTPDLNTVWAAWNDPEDIKQWNAASDDWHTTQSAVDLREGGKFSSRMEAKDGSAGFDFEGTYTRILPRDRRQLTNRSSSAAIRQALIWRAGCNQQRNRLCNETIKEIEQRGGKICVSKMAIPRVGWLAYTEDPASNVFGIIEPDTNAK